MIHGDSDTPPWLALARKDIGIREGRDDAKILAYRHFTKERPWVGTKGPGSAWCSDAVNAWFGRCEVRGTLSAGAASWRTWGRACQPAPGAVIVFGPHDPDAAGTGHVGLVSRVLADGWVEVLSGNCGNSVRLKRYRLADAVAIRWPLFS